MVEDSRSEVVHVDWLVEGSIHVPSVHALTGSSTFITNVPEKKPEVPEDLQGGGFYLAQTLDGRQPTRIDARW